MGFLAFALAGLLGGGGIILGRVFLELFDSTDGLGLSAAVLRVELQVVLRDLFLVVLGVEEEVFFVVDGGVGLAWVDGRIVGV